MRIIAGKFRSRPLLTPDGWETRPTSDRLRETLFNVLAPQIQGAVFADLFAGTGAVGLEALSRGARQVYFAENAKLPLATLRSNLERLAVQSQAQIEPGGTLPLLRRLVRQKILLDLVYLDPPYGDAASYEATLQFMAQNPSLSPEAIVIAEHARRSTLPQVFLHLTQYRVLEQGESALTFFRCNTSLPHQEST